MNKLPKIIKDSSYKRRGGSAKWLLITCSHCNSNLCIYQKDGPGNLYRLYADRIHSTDGNRPFLNATKANALKCSSCKSVIAVPMIYKKDLYPRLAFRLLDISINKQVLDKKGQVNNTDSINASTSLTLD